MKTIRFPKAAGGMLAALALVILTGPTFAEEAGRVRLTDDNTQTDQANGAIDADVIVRGASDIRRRNAQTTQALRQLFANGEADAQQPPSLIQQSSYDRVIPAAGCCPTCSAPAGQCDCPSGVSCAPGACDGCAPTTGAYGDACSPGACDSCDAYGYGRGGRRGQLGTCRHGNSRRDCPICSSRSCVNNNCVADFLCEQAAAHRARNRLASYNLNQYLRCKLGYFIHDGHGGVGSPLFGHYSIVYPADPGYFDSRDGGVYAAQGYGGAVSVPLAPTVRHTYNYGWGLPSSRLTPVSNTMP